MASQSNSRGAIINDLKADLSDKTKLQNDLQTAVESLAVARTATETLHGELKVKAVKFRAICTCLILAVSIQRMRMRNFRRNMQKH